MVQDYKDVMDILTNIQNKLTEIEDRQKEIDRKLDTVLGRDKMSVSSETLSSTEVCKLIKRGRSTLYRMLADNEIPCYRQGKKYVFMKEEIMEWLTERGRRQDSLD